MKKETNNPTTAPERILIRRESAKISRMTADLSKTCEILNRAISRLNAADLLPGGITKAIVCDLIHGDTKAIINALETSLNEIENPTYAMRQIAAQMLENDKNTLAQIMRGVADDFRKNAFVCGEIYTAQRAELVELVDGVATFNPDAVAEYYSEYATGKQIEYIAEARKLFDCIVEFDRKTRIFSNGKAHAISDGRAENLPGIIEVYNGRLFFDAAAVSHLDNLGADTTTETKINNFTIVNPER